MNMKKASAILLSVMALCASQAHANNSWKVSNNKSSSRPHKVCSWHAANDFNIGMVDHHTSAQDDGYNPMTMTISGAKGEFSQSVGYSYWFDLRLRASAAISMSEDYTDEVGAYTASFGAQGYLFNADAYLFFPAACLHKGANVRLVPAIGWGIRQAYLKGKTGSATDDSLYRNRVLMPLAGLYLQFEPTDRFFVKGGFTAQFPDVTQKILFATLGQSKQRLKARRLGVGSDFEMRYALGDFVSLNGKCEYLSYSATGPNDDFIYTKEFSYTLGVRLSY